MKKKLKLNKMIKITILSLLAIIILFGSLSCLIIKYYLNKMNLVTADSRIQTEQFVNTESTEDNYSTLHSETADSEYENETITDSPKKEILSLEDKIRQNMEENSTPIAASEDVYNILLIGSDTRESGDLGRSDAMILISVNEADKTITASSFLRDIYLLIPGAGYNRINAAYAIGGADLLMDTIEENFKIQVDRYVAIDFLAFIDVIDAIGGITIEVTEEEIPVINEYIRELNEIRGEETEADYLTKPGTLLLNGKQALGFARNRYTGNADFERTARQRKVLEQIFIKIKSLGILDLSSLMNTLLPKITTNLTEGELFYQILALPRYTGYELRQWSIPAENTFSYLSIRGMSVIGIDFKQNIAELHSRIYSDDIEKNNIKENKNKKRD